MTARQSKTSRYAAEARRRWPGAKITGDGPHARVVHCDPQTVTLFGSRVEAGRATRLVDVATCGKTCRGNHETVTIDTVTTTKE